MDLNEELIAIKGIGAKTAQLFEKLQIHTVKDLLFYTPSRYETFEKAILISNIQEDMPTVTIKAILETTPTSKRVRKLSIINAVVKDESDSVQLTFFNMPYLTKYLKKGYSYYFRGKPIFKNNKVTMEQPLILTEKEYKERVNTMQGHYPLTKGLTNKTILKAVTSSLNNCIIKDYLPKSIIAQQKLQPLSDSIHQIHVPKNYEAVLEARRRLVFDEFFFFFYYIRKMKELGVTLKNEVPMNELLEIEQFIMALPFRLTKGQAIVWNEIKNELLSDRVMNRLVQGDVGSGKTILALLSILMVCGNGYQAALMAPTEVLATQHFNSFEQYIMENQLPIRAVLLVGSLKQKEKNEAYAKILDGRVNLVIGTHAVIQDKVVFQKLALVITDEQHRFGVKQREKLMKKGISPHVLVMSATPIPRTLAIICYGDLHVSRITELPAKRLPIKNCVVDTSYRDKAYQFIGEEIKKGRQAFIICPMVEESETMDLENVIDYTEKIKHIFPQEIKIAYLHGKMSGVEKNEVMQQFKENNIQILVSTTVIEVGVNVPNTTVMMVENAERFGLAQLHQLRGRVGRGEYQSYCIFVNDSKSKESKERLKILEQSNDGFKIAEEDLRLRGPGDVFGIMQSGAFDFKIGDIYKDQDILKEAALVVDGLLLKDQGLQSEEHSLLKEAMEQSIWKPIDTQTI